MKLIDRRSLIHFLGAVVASGTSLLPIDAQLLTPLNLKLKRDQNLPQTLSLGDCITGKLYIINPGTTSSDPSGTYVSDTLELPWRSNNSEISAIPPGDYDGTVREDGKLGWSVELADPKGVRQHIEIHIGNWPRNSTGCILLGTNRSGSCTVLSSGDALYQLRGSYGSSTSRVIRLHVE